MLAQVSIRRIRRGCAGNAWQARSGPVAGARGR